MSNSLELNKTEDPVKNCDNCKFFEKYTKMMNQLEINGRCDLSYLYIKDCHSTVCNVFTDKFSKHPNLKEAEICMYCQNLLLLNYYEGHWEKAICRKYGIYVDPELNTCDDYEED